MVKHWFVSLAVVGAVFAGGCPSDDDSSGDDGGVAGSAAGSSAGGSGGAAAGSGSSGKLQSGTYDVSNVQKISDGCGLALEDGSFTSTELVNTGTKLSIGKKYDSSTDPQWSPSGYGLGTGEYTSATTATLTVTTHSKISDGCEFDLTRTTKVTYTGDNAVSVDFTDEESNQNSKCSEDNFESTKDCTSHYKFDLSM